MKHRVKKDQVKKHSNTAAVVMLLNETQVQNSIVIKILIPA